MKITLVLDEATQSIVMNPESTMEDHFLDDIFTRSGKGTTLKLEKANNVNPEDSVTGFKPYLLKINHNGKK